LTRSLKNQYLFTALSNIILDICKVDNKLKGALNLNFLNLTINREKLWLIEINQSLIRLGRS